jgi:hypothetical protein
VGDTCTIYTLSGATLLESGGVRHAAVGRLTPGWCERRRRRRSGSSATVVAIWRPIVYGLSGAGRGGRSVTNLTPAGRHWAGPRFGIAGDRDRMDDQVKGGDSFRFGSHRPSGRGCGRGGGIAAVDHRARRLTLRRPGGGDAAEVGPPRAAARGRRTGPPGSAADPWKPPVRHRRRTRASGGRAHRVAGPQLT